MGWILKNVNPSTDPNRYANQVASIANSKCLTFSDNAIQQYLLLFNFIYKIA